jgi:uncharacterized protein (UPF0303 family)
VPEPTDPAADLARIAHQEQQLVFPAFDEDTAWRVGSRLRGLAAGRGLAVAIEVRLHGHTVFFTAMPGTAPANADWARRKRNVVEWLHQSSYAVGVEDAMKGRSTIEVMGLPDRDLATHGGSVPVRVTGVGVVGAVTVSGLPQRDDHELVIEVFAELLGRSYAELRLR